MTPRQQTASAYVLLALFFVVVPLLVVALRLPAGWALASCLGSAIVFAIWRWTFNCAKCGRQLLWDGEHGLVIHRRFLPPRSCPKCGTPTDR